MQNLVIIGKHQVEIDVIKR